VRASVIVSGRRVTAAPPGVPVEDRRDPMRRRAPRP
jgi:hypothetical protein